MMILINGKQVINMTENENFVKRMLQRLVPKRQNFSIDLGTFSTLIYEPGTGIVLNEPSVVAIKNSAQKEGVVAVGHEARQMLGRTPDNIKAIRPLANGVIADFSATEVMLTHFIEKVYRKIVSECPHSCSLRSRFYTSGTTSHREAAYGAGAKKVLLIDEPMAAALGADMPVSDATASMVVDIGGGTTEVAIISLNGIVYSESVRVGGDHFDEAIIKYVRRNFGCAIGEATAEKVKRSIAQRFNARCRDYDSGRKFQKVFRSITKLQ